MTYEQIEKTLKSSALVDDSGQRYEFRTLTLFHNKEGYKLAARWAQNLDLSGVYKKTLKEAFESLKANLPEHLGDGWTLQ
jgi:hypothetical protein